MRYSVFTPLYAASFLFSCAEDDEVTTAITPLILTLLSGGGGIAGLVFLVKKCAKNQFRVL